MAIRKSLFRPIICVSLIAVLVVASMPIMSYAQQGGYSLGDFDLNKMKYHDLTRGPAFERADWKVIYDQSVMKFDWSGAGLRFFETLSEFGPEAAVHPLAAAAAVGASALSSVADNSYAGSYRLIVEESMGEKRYTIYQRTLVYNPIPMKPIPGTEKPQYWEPKWVPLSAGETAMAFLEMGYKPPDALWQQDISSSVEEFKDKYPEQWSAFEDWRKKYKPPSSIHPPNDHDGNGGPGGQIMDPTKGLWLDFWKTTQFQEDLGGINFASIHLSYISTWCNPLGEYDFNFVLKGRKTVGTDKIIDLENATELSAKSFLIGLSIPDNSFWVNLNPWEPDRIIEKDLEETDVGRIMLEADLQMKKDFCKYEKPCETEVGEKYWKFLDEKREELVIEIMKKHPNEIKDIKNVQFRPVTRHWIVPDKVEAYETDNEIYIVNAILNIYSEPVYEHSTYEIVNQDAFFVSRACKDDLSEAAKEYGRYAKELEEEMILPLVVQEVNHGKDYSDLRCIYNSLALAQWYKDKYRYSPSIFTDFMDSKNLTGLESKSEWSAENIWRDYVKSFEEGEYHCWKNETYQEGDYIITSTKHYSSGGVDFGDIETTIVGDMPSDLRDLTSEAVYSLFAKEGNDYYFGDGLYVFYEGLEKARFEISKLIISPAIVKIGKPVTITVDVHNHGHTEDNETINIEINGEIVGSKEVTLAPGETMTLEFTQIQSAEGDHSVTVGGLTGNYEVVTTTPGFEVLFAIIGLLSVVYLINRKKKKKRK